MLKNLSTATILVVVLNASLAMAQTNASKPSAVGTWKLDLKQSTFGSEAPPKSVTLTIIKDTPDAGAWRVDVVDDKGQSHSYSWSGPTDGTMQDLKTPDGQVAGKESVKRDGDTLIRHGENPKDGSSFDARSTLSADGKTITDVVTEKSKDGKTSKTTGVFHRVAGAKPAGK
jgi:hypothetical protein